MHSNLIKTKLNNDCKIKEQQQQRIKKCELRRDQAVCYRSEMTKKKNESGEIYCRYRLELV